MVENNVRLAQLSAVKENLSLPESRVENAYRVSQATSTAKFTTIGCLVQKYKSQSAKIRLSMSVKSMKIFTECRKIG